jgi:cytidylate kinase
MPLIAMTREMGSLGKDVAAGLSQALGIPVAHAEYIDVLADRMRVRKSHVIRLLEGKAGLFERLNGEEISISIYTAAETLWLAKQAGGIILRGWGPPFLLRDVPHAVCVRVCAPHRLRVQRMKERLNTDGSELVEREIANSDEAHCAIIRRNFHADWREAELYDLALNTERVSTDECVEEILKLVRSASFAETDASRQKLENLSLEAAVKAAFRGHAETRNIGVQVVADQGVVTLLGMVKTNEGLEHGPRIASEVAGVKEVRNELRSIKESRDRSLE